MKVHVIVSLFSGVIDQIKVFGDDESKTGHDKAMDYLREYTGEEFKTEDEFDEWYQAQGEVDQKDEYRWEICTIE